MKKELKDSIIIGVNNNIREFKNINNKLSRDNNKRKCKDVSKYSGDMVCPNCKGIRINKFGRQNNKQRYICRDCRKTFITEEKKIKRYSEDFKMETLGWYLEGNSIRGIERRLKVSDTSIIGWIRKFGDIIKNKLEEAKNNINYDTNRDNIKNNIEIMEIDELVTYVKKNLKTGETEEKKKEIKKEIIPGYGLLLIGTKIILLTLR